MPAKKSNVGMGVALLSATALLGLFFLYMYTFNYNARPLQETSKDAIPMVRANVEVNSQLINGVPTLCANLHLANAGKGRLRLLDTVSTDPLYNLQLSRIRADGGAEMVGMQRERLLSTQLKAAFDPDKDTELTLLPGRTLTVRFPLDQSFDLSGAVGHYKLDVNYRPDQVLQLLSADQPRPSPDIVMINCQTEFDLPLAAPKPAVAPTPPAKPAPAEEPQQK